jgi:hypothetical protein
MAVDAARTLAKNKNADLWFNDGQMHMVDKGHAPKGGTFVLNSQTGLIGLPVESPEGIHVRALIHPDLQLKGTILKINEASIQRAFPSFGPNADGSNNLNVNPLWDAQIKALATADGYYKIVYTDFDGDTRGIPWYANMVCIGITGTDDYIVNKGKVRDDSQSQGPANATPSVPNYGGPTTPTGGAGHGAA